MSTSQKRPRAALALGGSEREWYSQEQVYELIEALDSEKLEVQMQRLEMEAIQEELQSAHDKYRDLFDRAPVGYLTIDEQGRIFEANLTSAWMLQAGVAEIVGKRVSEFVAPADQDTWYLHRRKLLKSSGPKSCELRMIRKTGVEFFARLEGSAALAAGEALPNGPRAYPGTVAPNLTYAGIQALARHPVAYRIVISDITERRWAAESLLQSQEAYRLVAQAANDGLWDWDLRTNRIYFSARWKAMFGCTEVEIGSEPEQWFQRVHPDDVQRVRSALAAHRKSGSGFLEFEYRVLRPGEPEGWVRCRALAVADGAGNACRMVGSQSDITERKAAELRLIYQALHDGLTGLPNRALFLDRLENRMKRWHREQSRPFAVMFLDLDRFKIVNDSLGHTLGDKLLIETARRLESCLREGDTLARLGGDEFTCLLEELTEPGQVAMVAERMRQALAVPVELGDKLIHVGASIGVAVGSTEYNHPEEMLRDADTAMYHAKVQEQSRFVVFDQKLHSGATGRLQLEQELRRAIGNRELEIHYQPIVRLTNGATEALEGLVRWRHPQRGLLAPADFLPVAEDAGLIVAIDHWVIREACLQLSDWLHKGIAPVLVSTNVSRQTLLQPGLLDTIDQALRQTGVDPAQLGLEISEQAFAQGTDVFAEVFDQVRARRLDLCLDDFGAAYSSLGCLTTFPVTRLKIDRSLVQRGGQRELTVIQSIVGLAHKLGLEVTAEGIETEGQLAAMREAGADFGQGYLFAPAAPASELTLDFPRLPA